MTIITLIIWLYYIMKKVVVVKLYSIESKEITQILHCKSQHEHRKTYWKWPMSINQNSYISSRSRFLNVKEIHPRYVRFSMHLASEKTTSYYKNLSIPSQLFLFFSYYIAIALEKTLTLIIVIQIFQHLQKVDYNVLMYIMYNYKL